MSGEREISLDWFLLSYGAYAVIKLEEIKYIERIEPIRGKLFGVGRLVTETIPIYEVIEINTIPNDEAFTEIKLMEDGC